MEIKEKPFLALERHYPVAPEKVYKAWTDPEAIKRWWGPGGQNAVSLAELDVRVGGRLRIVFGGADGKENECAGIYKEVVPNRRLVFSWHWPRTTPERVSVVTITLAAAPGGTHLALRHEQFFDEAARDGHRRGWSAALENLEAFLQPTPSS
jgi:uncharacterized protein YndB with AHSA1/START domain